MLIEPVIRPPSEANSFLLQVTLGCSVNSCTFCGAYPDKPFKAKSLPEIFNDISDCQRHDPDTRRVFLCDGDALVLGNNKLIPILQKLQEKLPRLAKVSSYANAQNILAKTASELQELAQNKLTLLFLGLESGNDTVLTQVKKKATAAEMVTAVQKAQANGLKVHVIVLLGLGGQALSREHAQDTAAVLNQMQPSYLSLLSVMLVPGTELYTEYQQNKFQLLSETELLQEAAWLIADLELQHTIFRSDHASNYLSLEGRFPKDKAQLLATIHAGLHGQIKLRPETLRGL